MRDERKPLSFALALVAGYALGLIGWTWDTLEHLRSVQLGFGPAPAHYLSALGIVLVLAVLVPLRSRVVRHLPVYVWLAIGATVLFFVQPVAGSIMLLALLLRASRPRTRQTSYVLYAVASAGVALVLTGSAIDWFWHTANPVVNEETANMLLMPGHQVQLLGWSIGLVGTGALLLRLAEVSRQAVD